MRNQTTMILFDLIRREMLNLIISIIYGVTQNMVPIKQRNKFGLITVLAPELFQSCDFAP